MLGQSFWGFWGFLRLLVSLCLRYCQSALWVFVPEHITDSLLIMGPDWSVVTVSPQWATTHIQQSAVCQRRSGSTHITAGRFTDASSAVGLSNTQSSSCCDSAVRTEHSLSSSLLFMFWSRPHPPFWKDFLLHGESTLADCCKLMELSSQFV